MTPLLDGSRRLSLRLESLAEAERDQLPLWLPVGLILGIGAWFWLPDRAQWIAFLLAALGLALGSVALGGGTRWGRSACHLRVRRRFGLRPDLVEGGARRRAAPRARWHDGSHRHDRKRPALAAERVIRLVVRPAGAGLPHRLRVNVDEDKAVAGLDAGATVRLRAWLMPPAPMAVPGAYDFARVAWFQRIGGTGRALGIVLVEPAAGAKPCAPESPAGASAFRPISAAGSAAPKAASPQRSPPATSSAFPRTMPRRCAAPASPICFRSAASTSPPWSAR